MKRLGRIIISIIMLLLHSELSAACNETELKEKLNQVLPDVSFDVVQSAPMKGWCELSIGTKVFYVEEDSLLLFSGDLVSLKNGENISNKRRAGLVKDILSSSLTKQEMLIVPSANVKTHITVFTDIDCPYCRKFHEEVPLLQARGLEVRYLLFPRAGLKGPVYDKSVSVWCARDRVNAITLAKKSRPVAMVKCNNPIKKHYDLGRKLGITGTPTIILPDGNRIDGYIQSDELLRILGL